MTPRQRRGMVERLNLLNEGAAITIMVTPKTALPRKRRIPRKPSPAQIERFEALRARVMGIPESR
ncbi:hypothetical protein [Acetobacter senegalensis]|uniref:hypothetical protein n=1 Tax=Acetobacter senegalensis TaxID=446692 RepID=UPI00128B3DA5|nr:hypothetical protein [Acetobacter senegalensis]MPQ73639.1 hypothetical protein [Acetobacter senegalensis]